jgi:hypothetical protein
VVVDSPWLNRRLGTRIAAFVLVVTATIFIRGRASIGLELGAVGMIVVPLGIVLLFIGWYNRRPAVRRRHEWESWTG